MSEVLVRAGGSSTADPLAVYRVQDVLLLQWGRQGGENHRCTGSTTNIDRDQSCSIQSLDISALPLYRFCIILIVSFWEQRIVVVWTEFTEQNIMITLKKVAWVPPYSAQMDTPTTANIGDGALFWASQNLHTFSENILWLLNISTFQIAGPQCCRCSGFGCFIFSVFLKDKSGICLL